MKQEYTLEITVNRKVALLPTLLYANPRIEQGDVVEVAVTAIRGYDGDLVPETIMLEDVDVREHISDADYARIKREINL